MKRLLMSIMILCASCENKNKHNYFSYSKDKLEYSDKTIYRMISNDRLINIMASNAYVCKSVSNKGDNIAQIELHLPSSNDDSVKVIVDFDNKTVLVSNDTLSESKWGIARLDENFWEVYLVEN